MLHGDWGQSADPGAHRLLADTVMDQGEAGRYRSIAVRVAVMCLRLRRMSRD